MKKRIPLIIKGILLSFLFVFAFNLNLGQATYQTSDNSYTVQGSVEQFAKKGQSNILVPTVLAQPTEVIVVNKEKEVTELVEQAMKLIAVGATYVHRFFHPMINFFAFHTGNFLGTDYIYQGAMGDMLKRIWIVSRNVVNILFVLILLVLALKEIFWIKEEGSDLKKNLIKFVLLLVAINFSWMATKVVLDAANVATNVVFSIPMGVGSVGSGIDFQECDVPDTKTTVGLCYPTAIYAPVDTKDAKNWQYMKATGEESCESNKVEEEYAKAYPAEEDNEGKITGYGENPKSEYYGKTTYCWGTVDFFKYNKNTSTIYLTYGMARIQNLVNSTADESIVQLSVGILFSLLLQTAYVIALLALFLALIVRMAFLWIFVAFSPFLIVLFFYTQQKGIGEGDTQFSIEAFIKWAFVTVKVGAVFSVAFIMVSAGQALTLKTPDLFDNLNKSGVEVTGKLFKVKSLFMGMDSIQEFIWLLITLVILWGGVFSVLGKMPVVSVATNWMDDLGKRAGKWMATTPYWAPIMPMVDPNTQELKYGSMESQYVKLKDSHDKWRQRLRYGEAGVEEYEKMDKAAIEISGSPAKKAAMVKLIDDGLIRGDVNAAHKFTKEYGVDVNTAHTNSPAFKAALTKSGFDSDQQQRAVELIEKAYERGPMGVKPGAKTETREEKELRRKEERQDIAAGTKAGTEAAGGGATGGGPAAGSQTSGGSAVAPPDTGTK